MSWYRLIKDERGVAAVITALLFTVIGAMGALSVDAGQLYVARSQVKTACDAAVLAGAQELPGNPVGAEAIAITYMAANDRGFTDVTVSVTGNRLTVSAKTGVEFGLAKLLGVSEGSTAASSSAIIGQIGAARGLLPFGVEDLPFEFGDQYILKLNSDGVSGNFRALALGGTGASNYRKNLINGYGELLEVGSTVDTEPGVMAGPTRTGIADRLASDSDATYETVGMSSPRFLLVPMVHTETYAGRTEVTIVGFAAFFLEGYGTYNGNFGIAGRFLERFVDGTISETATDYGLRTIRLIQ